MYILLHSSSLPIPSLTLKKLKCILLMVLKRCWGIASLYFKLCGGFKHALTGRKARNLPGTATYSGQVVWRYIISLIGFITVIPQDLFIFGLLLFEN